ncbi:MAG: DUF3877 family protein [Lachnospiraceae bacterium]|nr:DUF3877 family protein [Lachnospiraceae bacterium]
MTLEKHIVDTMKEWQLKMGSLNSVIVLYYPEVSIQKSLNLDESLKGKALGEQVCDYLEKVAPYLGKVSVLNEKDRMGIKIGKEGCRYVEEELPEPEFLKGFLEVLKQGDFNALVSYATEFAKAHGTALVIEEKEEDPFTSLHMENPEVEPYYYCVEDNEFGLHYHRFSKGDFENL